MFLFVMVDDLAIKAGFFPFLLSFGFNILWVVCLCHEDFSNVDQIGNSIRDFENRATVCLKILMHVQQNRRRYWGQHCVRR